jgi:hypothetical protein
MIELHNDTVKEVNGLWEDVKRKFREAESDRRAEVAELKATVTELRAELREMRAIQESARTLSRGEQGLAGPRGIPGAQGPAGPRGKQGERGAPAAMTVAYEPDPARFSITPVHSDGSRGVPLHLKALFEAYNAATEGDEE